MSAREKVQDAKDKAYKLKVQGRLMEAQEILLSAISDNPSNAFLRTSLADLYYRQGKLREAETLAREVLELYPEDKRALIVMGNVEYKRKNLKKAQDYFLQAWGDGNLYAALRLGHTYLKMKKYDKALGLAQEVLEDNSNDSKFLSIKARAMEGLDKREEARELYKTLSEGNPENDFAKSKYLELSMEKMDPERAVKEMNRMMKVKKDDASLLAAQASSLERTGDVLGAAKAYEKAAEIESKNEYYLSSAGFRYKDAGQYGKAMEFLKKAFQIDPRNFPVRSSLISCAKKAGKLQELLSFLEELLEENPDSSKIWGAITLVKGEMEKSND